MIIIISLLALNIYWRPQEEALTYLMDKVISLVNFWVEPLP